MKLSASLYSNTNFSVVKLAEELEPYLIDYWHIDSIENKRVFDDIDKLAQVSKTAIDLHIISKNPTEFYTEFYRDNIRRISFQIEELDENFIFPSLPEKEIGLAIHIDHQNLQKKINQYQHQVKFVLLMMTTPGVSGGKFGKENFSTLRSLVNEFPNIYWCVDGGVDHEISYILRLIGIQSIVVGSYLMNHNNMASAILNIRSNYVRSEYKISDFQIPVSKLPIVSEMDNVIDMLRIMEIHKLGVVFCVNNHQEFIGIITNADVRRILINGDFSYDMSISSLLNRTPKTIFEYQSTAEMIDEIKGINFPILVLPIISKKGTLTGAISFHKLLKEE